MGLDRVPKNIPLAKTICCVKMFTLKTMFFSLKISRLPDKLVIPFRKTKQPIFSITVHAFLYCYFLLRLISRSERDLLSVEHDGPDDMHAVARHAVKRGQRASLPRGFGSTECIHTSDQSLEMPDRVIKVYKADQTCKYFMVYKVSGKIDTCCAIDDSQCMHGLKRYIMNSLTV